MHPINSRRRQLATLFALPVLPMSLWAQPRQKIVALSAIGDRIVLASRVSRTASLFDRNRQDARQLKSRALDEFALGVVARLLASDPRNPEVELVLPGVPAGSVAEQEEKLLSTALVTAEKVKAAHAVVISKFSGPAQVSLGGNSGAFGEGGNVDGVGFYIDNDNSLTVTNMETLKSGRGLISAFAYFRVSLIDVEKAVVAARRDATEYITRSGASAPDGEAWNAFSEQERGEVLQGLIARGLTKHIAEMFKLTVRT